MKDSESKFVDISDIWEYKLYDDDVLYVGHKGDEEGIVLTSEEGIDDKSVEMSNLYLENRKMKEHIFKLEKEVERLRRI